MFDRALQIRNRKNSLITLLDQFEWVKSCSSGSWCNDTCCCFIYIKSIILTLLAFKIKATVFVCLLSWQFLHVYCHFWVISWTSLCVSVRNFNLNWTLMRGLLTSFLNELFLCIVSGCWFRRLSPSHIRWQLVSVRVLLKRQQRGAQLGAGRFSCRRVKLNIEADLTRGDVERHCLDLLY